MGGPKPRPADDEGAPRPIDDEGLPRPPPVHGKRPCGLLKALDRGESITFMAIAVGLLVIALVMFAEGTHALVVAPPDEQFAVAITRAVNSALFHRGGARTGPNHHRPAGGRRAGLRDDASNG